MSTPTAASGQTVEKKPIKFSNLLRMFFFFFFFGGVLSLRLRI